MRESTETEPLVAYVTAPDMDCARTIASALVDERHAACVNIVPHVESVYRWQGNIETDSEALLIIKTRANCMEGLKNCLQQLHPDEVPECIALPITQGSRPYLSWLAEQTG